MNIEKKEKRRFVVIEIEESENLLRYFDRFGLQFHSARDLYVKEGVLVWSSAYTLDQFNLIVRNLVKVFNSHFVGFGKRMEDGEYELEIFEASHNTYSLKESKAVNEREIIARLGKMQRRLCLVGSECLMGAYERERIVKELRREV